MESPLHEVPTTPCLRMTYYGDHNTPCTDAVVPEFVTSQSPGFVNQYCVPGTPATPVPACFTPQTGTKVQWPENVKHQTTPFKTPTRTRTRCYVASPADHLVPTTPVPSNTGSTPRMRGSSIFPKNLQSDSESPFTARSYIDTNCSQMSPFDNKIDTSKRRHENGRKTPKVKSTANNVIVHSRKALMKLRRSPEAKEVSNNMSKSPDFLDLI